MVTHDPRAAAIADRILFIADGLIVKELTGASAAEVLAVMGDSADRCGRLDVIARCAQRPRRGASSARR